MKSGTHLETVLAQGGFAVTAELSQPVSTDLSSLRQQIRALRPVVDALNFVDNPLGEPRLSSLASAQACLEEGVEPVLQVTCRDRNSAAIQADVLGAAALGIRNVLCLTGDHQSQGTHAMSQGVFELDSVQLIQLLRRMRDEGKLRNEQPVTPPPPLFIGGAKNPFSGPLELRVTRLGQKIRAGANFIQTQPVLDIEYFSRWMELVREHGYERQVSIIAGVLVFKSHKVLKFMKKHLPGTRVPEALVQRIEQAQDIEAEAIAASVDLANALIGLPGVRGLHFMAAGARLEELVPHVIDRLRLQRQQRGHAS